MKKVMYYNPKTNKYVGADVLKIEGDTVYLKNKCHEYTESLQNLNELSKQPNPNWHGIESKPLIKML